MAFANVIPLISWDTKGAPPMPPPPGNKALLRDHGGLSGGVTQSARAVPLDSHDGMFIDWNHYI